MKLYLRVSILALALLAFNLRADYYTTINTPNSSSVEVLVVTTEFSQDYLNVMDASMINNYPAATFLSPVHQEI